MSRSNFKILFGVYGGMFVASGLIIPIKGLGSRIIEALHRDTILSCVDVPSLKD